MVAIQVQPAKATTVSVGQIFKFLVLQASPVAKAVAVSMYHMAVAVVAVVAVSAVRIILCSYLPTYLPTYTTPATPTLNLSIPYTISLTACGSI